MTDQAKLSFRETMRFRFIYVFRINDEQHDGCLKIGEATAPEGVNADAEPDCRALNDAAHDRIHQYTQTAGVRYELLHTRLAVGRRPDDALAAFSDHDVHRVLIASGVGRHVFGGAGRANEWFEVDLATAKRAIEAAADGRQSLTPGEVSTGRSPIIFRPEQRKAIDMAKAQFRRGSRMLWNAKMRFGKTLSALQLAREMNCARTIILTHRPVVDHGWFEDFGKIFYDKGGEWRYGSKSFGDGLEALLAHAECADGHIVYFASMQDLRGSDAVGGKFDKNSAVFSAAWNLIIVDEAHEGTQTSLGRNVIEALYKPRQGAKLLELSGTPFNLLENNDYSDGSVFTWDYISEQRAKMQWDQSHPGDPNPYADLPTMNIYTYDLGRLIGDFIEEEDVEFNFAEFFRVGAKGGKFIHEGEVARFLNLLCREGDSLYPYSDEHFRSLFRHTLWVLPGVASAKALADMLRAHPVFQTFTVVNVAGDGDDGAGAEALRAVREAIGPDPDSTRTITLSCGRLTTGVSVPAWTGVFVLSGSSQTAVASYMQTIFRVQTPFRHAGRVKDQCYVFDFAPDRTLKVVAATAEIAALRAGAGGGRDEVMGDFLSFCPVIAMDGSRMRKYDAAGLIEQLKKVQIERVVSHGFEDSGLYDANVIGSIADLDVKDFESLRAIIGTTSAMPRTKEIVINNSGLDGAPARAHDDELKDDKPSKAKDEAAQLLKKRREAAISILRGISIRMPLLIFGADIADEDKDLTIDNFADLVDDASWEEFMPAGVTKDVFRQFRRYYDAAVFHAAGVRIRRLARSADNVGVELRIARLAAIFSTFRNPDKETVLTPWRVVNMHLAETLGGYAFFDELWRTELETPRLVDRPDVTSRVFHPEARILEVNSKSGLYPLYVAYSIYRARRRRYESLWGGDLSVREEQKLWDMTISDNVFVVCKTPMAAAITRRTLMGFRTGGAANIVCVPDIIGRMEQEVRIVGKLVLLPRKIRSPKFWNKISFEHKTMEFDAVVGNPPYQVMDGGNGVSARPVYNNFVTLAKSLNPNFISMITPSRWFAGGKGLDDFRGEMLNDERIKKIVDFTNAKDCFPSTSIGGGINYFLWEASYKGECEFTLVNNGVRDAMMRSLHEFPVFIRYNRAVSVIHKVKSLRPFNSFEAIVSSRNPYNLATNFRGGTEFNTQL